MQSKAGSRFRPRRAKPGPPRFMKMSVQESNTAELLHGCPVVTTAGERIGVVDHLMVDAVTHQLRFVLLARRRQGAVVAIPWHTLYFDSEKSRLVFYTFA
ncbi:MAG TPA: PRC-barrel domain-containing protein [Noviherbaspirillum sp.]|jgi:sporulation protein YlmC with PRC-barrel domain|uniref:PRC-barrel domain-containing protein n=1 Tax=Noviherbaspirillum sp. TaxID=1926288 RepID=UPI002F9297A3